MLRVRSNAFAVVGKFARLRLAGQIRVACGIDRDAAAELHVAAADERRVDELRAGRVELADEGLGEVLRRAGALERTHGGREVGRLGRAADVSVPARVDGDAVALLEGRAADERRVLDARVDDQVAVVPVAADGEAEALAVQHEVARDGNVLAGDDLVRDRPRVGERPERRVDRERAAVRECDPPCACVSESDVGRPRAGSHAELVLERATVLAHAQVYSVPEVAVDELAVVRHVRPPARRVSTIEVVDRAGSAARALRPRCGIVPEEAQGQRYPGRALRLHEREQQRVARRGERVAVSLHVEADARIRLAAIRDEAEREPGVRGDRAVELRRRRCLSFDRCRSGRERDRAAQRDRPKHAVPPEQFDLPPWKDPWAPSSAVLR